MNLSINDFLKNIKQLDLFFNNLKKECIKNNQRIHYSSLYKSNCIPSIKLRKYNKNHPIYNIRNKFNIIV